MKTIDSLNKTRDSQYFRGFEGVDGPTPIWLCESQIDKIPCDYSDANTKWLVPAAGHGTHGIILFWKYMEGLSKIFIDSEQRSRHILENILYLNEINPWLCRQLRKQGFINVIEGDYLEYETNVKFDCIVANYPFEKSVGKKKTQAIWPKFVEKSLSLLKYGGIVSEIHPDGWRNPYGDYKWVQELIKEKKVLRLEIYDEIKGLEVFGKSTTFDVLTIQNSKKCGYETIMKDSVGNEFTMVLDNVEYVPNGEIDLFTKIIAKDNEEKVELIYSRSAYGTDKKHVSNLNDNTFIYPCVYTTTKDGSINLKYSDTNGNGHFGVPKVIWSNGVQSSLIMDSEGQYGLTQFSYGITDTEENLNHIYEAMNSERFIKLMKFADGKQHKYKYKVISTFRKDFWKEFIDE
jgi:hypothetical protein